MTYQSGVRHSLQRSLVVLLFSSLCLVPFAPCLRAQTSPQSPPSQSTAPQSAVLTVPDGTPVRLRFAQPVYGLAVVGNDVSIQKDDKVRLVVADDVRINEKVAIAKGAAAQATVHRVWRPRNNPHLKQYDPVSTGLSLKLDWVSTITGAKAPVRVARKGRSKPFDVVALSGKGGFDIKPYGFSRQLFDVTTAAPLFTGRAFHDRQWIPVGARLLAYLDGDVTIDREGLEHAQDELPTPNLNATVYVFRTKDHDGVSPVIRCDQTELGAVGPRQTAATDLPPGEHSCGAEQSPPTKLMVESGTEYYLRLKKSAVPDRWELRRVSTGEGEDRVAETELLPPRPTSPNPSK